MIPRLHLAALLFLASVPAFAQFGNATRIQGQAVKAPLSCSDMYVLTFVAANNRFECLVNTGSSGTTGYSPNQTLAGCGVEYLTGLQFVVGACSYTISGVTYSAATTTETLSAADPTNPRIDVIGVDNTGAVFVAAGTPAATPQQPTIDPATQLGLTFIYVPAAATTPQNIGFRDIYEENTEWTSAVTANVNAASTNNPFRGTKDVEFTSAALTNAVTLVKPTAGTENLGAWNNLLFYIRSKATWASGNSGANALRTLTVTFLNGSTQIGTAVVLRDGSFGFASSTTGVYQQISVPLSLFGTGSNLITSIKFAVSGNSGSSTIGFYLDAITLQGGAGSLALPATLMNFRGAWNSTTAYAANDTVTSGGISYVALTTNTNVAVTTAATWSPLALNIPYKTICLPVGANNGSVLIDTDLGPFSRYFLFDRAQTVLQISVAGDAGTPNIIVGRSRAGSIVNLTSAALATASSGGIACSNTGGTTGIDGTTTCSATLQNTGINAGDWLTLVSGTAGGVAKEMTACVTTTVL